MHVPVAKCQLKRCCFYQRLVEKRRIVIVFTNLACNAFPHGAFLRFGFLIARPPQSREGACREVPNGHRFDSFVAQRAELSAFLVCLERRPHEIAVKSVACLNPFFLVSFARLLALTGSPHECGVKERDTACVDQVFLCLHSRGPQPNRPRGTRVFIWCAFKRFGKSPSA